MSRTIRLTEYDSLHPENYSKTMNSRILRARYIAFASTVRRNKHGAVLMQSGRVLSVGVNTTLNSETIWPTTHAEIAAAKVHSNVPNTVLYVVRLQPVHNTLINRPVNTQAVGTEPVIHLQLANSKPCADCLEYLTFGTLIKEVVYSI